MNVLKEFSDIWSIPVYGPNATVDEKDIKLLEDQLRLHLPEDYRSSILSTGVANGTMELWEWLEKQETKLNWKFWKTKPILWHINQFYSPSQMLEALGWRDAGMPHNLLPFAHDSMGNQFCFSIADLSADGNSSSNVIFWDHELGDTEVLARSFNQWLKHYIPSK